MFIRIISAFLIIVGAAGFFIPFWVGTVPGIDKIEMPLSEISDVAITDQRELFVAASFLGRVQRYSSGGEFLSSFAVDSAGGSFCLDIDGDELTVFVARRDAADIFDLSGNIIRTDAPISEADYQANCQYDAQVDTRVDRIIISFEEAGNPITIKRQVWHYLALNPFMSWATFALGLILFPEWRRRVLGLFKKQRSGAKPELEKAPLWLKLTDILLNVAFTVVAMAITGLGLILAIVATDMSDASSIAFGGIFSLSLISFFSYWTFKLWKSYADGFWGLPFDTSGNRAIAIKALNLILFAAYIFAVFYLGEKSARESGYYDDTAPAIESASDGL